MRNTDLPVRSREPRGLASIALADGVFDRGCTASSRAVVSTDGAGEALRLVPRRRHSARSPRSRKPQSMRFAHSIWAGRDSMRTSRRCFGTPVTAYRRSAAGAGPGQLIPDRLPQAVLARGPDSGAAVDPSTRNIAAGEHREGCRPLTDLDLRGGLSHGAPAQIARSSVHGGLSLVGLRPRAVINVTTRKTDRHPPTRRFQDSSWVGQQYGTRRSVRGSCTRDDRRGQPRPPVSSPSIRLAGR
jgi:hypothetical protein